MEPANCALVMVPVRSVVGKLPLKVVAVTTPETLLVMNPAPLVN